ncbi:GNAT family N-acetyltransferase [Nocardioides sp. zg-DK7169]|uniref:GNAT family N-acetyltransferase n=1 Tax=Nocardioides sp. zg-DK7169 TaxID=2736600 RepID=UPI0015578DA3|nr:GNAT family N-acetyltransferase [Nocardioides sp. zg-DK7169]NPC95829.1 GNAT family N-acetyltransferase [Nocardioides sp. zg-DK7169]
MTAGLLAAYDEQLRTDSEAIGASARVRLGPLHLLEFPERRGFVTYRDLGEGDEEELRARLAEWVPRVLTHFRERGVRRLEWKTRGHDRAPGLHELLLAHGFEPGEEESVMVGEARLLALDLPLPDGVSLRSVHAEDDVRAACAMLDEAFGDPVSSATAEALLGRLASGDGTELWVAEAGGEVVCAGRLEPVPDSDVAGLWGGATLEHWRGRGIYRALTAARARSALALGRPLLHSDSTAFSRPILERSGLVRVTTTTPYDVVL